MEEELGKKNRNFANQSQTITIYIYKYIYTYIQMYLYTMFSAWGFFGAIFLNDR